MHAGVESRADEPTAVTNVATLAFRDAETFAGAVAPMLASPKLPERDCTPADFAPIKLRLCVMASPQFGTPVLLTSNRWSHFAPVVRSK